VTFAVTYNIRSIPLELEKDLELVLLHAVLLTTRISLGIAVAGVLDYLFYQQTLPICFTSMLY
jgi:hypothetical protein